MARVFVSYRRVGPDNRIAKELYHRLSDLGHDVFLDEDRVRYGTKWPTEIRAALERAEWFVALVSLAYLDSRNCVDEELVVAGRRREAGTLAGIIPVRLAHEGDYPEMVRAVLTETQSFKWRGDDDTAAMIESIAATLPHPTNLVKGMLAFEQLDAAGFRELGREAEVEQCVAALAAPGVVVVHGVSGAGKTSFLRAGVLPRLPVGTWQLVTASTAARIDPATVAGAARLLVVDQFEQMIVAAKDAEIAAAFEQAALDWLAAATDRVLVLVIRDEFRTSLEATFPRLTAAARNVALFPLDPAQAAAALATILDSARIEFQRPFLDGVTAALVDGVPARVRPALLQLVAQHAIAAGSQRFDAAVWAGTPTQRRAFFERHVRTTVLDQLPAAIPRLDAARALRGLTAAELKSSPRTIAEVATDEQLTPVAVERVLDVAAAPHARVATAHLHGDVEQFELVHDLFAGAIQALVKDEEARARNNAQRRTLIGIALGAGLIAIAGVAAVVLWRRADASQREAEVQRAVAERRERREQASKLAAMAVRYKDESPGRALALAAEALDATAGDGASAEAMRATYEALAGTHGPALRGSIPHTSASVFTTTLVSADGRRAIAQDQHDGLQMWSLERPEEVPVRLPSVAARGSVLTPSGNHLLGWHDRLWAWDLRIEAPRPVLVAPAVHIVDTSPDGSTLVAGVAIDGDADAIELRIWDLAHFALDVPPAVVPCRVGAPEWLYTSPHGRWITVDGPLGTGVVDVAARTCRIIPNGATNPYDFVETIDDDGVLYLSSTEGRSWVAQVVPPETRVSRLVTTPDLAAGSAWGQTADDVWRLFITGGRRTRMCVLAPAAAVHCPIGTGLMLDSRRGWFATTDALTFLGDAADGFRASYSVPWPGVRYRDYDRYPVRSAGIDAQGRVAVVTTPDAVVMWPLVPRPVDGRLWTGATPSPPVPEPESPCAALPGGDPIVSRDGAWAVVHLSGENERTELRSCDGTATAPQVLGAVRLEARFAPSSRRLVTWDRDTAVEVWTRVGASWTSRLVDINPAIDVAAFSPDDRWIAVGARGVWLGDLEEPPTRGDGDVAVHQLAGPPLNNAVAQMVFRDDSRQLAMITGSTGDAGPATVATWDIDVFVGGGEPSLLVDEVPDGALAYHGEFLFELAAGAVIGTWPVTPARLREQARRHGGRNLSIAEWRATFGERPYAATFGELPAHPSVVEARIGEIARMTPEDQRAAYRALVAQLLPHGDPGPLRDVCYDGLVQGAAAEVLAACRRVAELFPFSARHADFAAIATVIAGERAEAIAAVAKVVELARDDPDVDVVNLGDERAGWLEMLRRGETPDTPYDPP